MPSLGWPVGRSSTHIKIALHSVTPTEEAELWRLVYALEAVMKVKARSLEAELEHIDRELEERFRR
jgi:hypothetical protein